MDWVTTSTILQGLRDFENADAWDRFAGRFRAPLAAFVEKMGIQAADVDDVVQETLVAFARAHRAGGFDPAKGKLSRWLFGIAHKQALRQLRRYPRGRMQPRTEPGKTDFLERFPDESSAGDLWEQTWERFLTLDCLERIRKEIPPRSYRVFELCVIEDLPAAEVAEHLGLELKAVYNIKHRTLKRIREVRAGLEEAE